MTRRYDPETDDRVVRHLFQCMLSDEQIADRLNVSPTAIPPARGRMGLGRPKGRQPIVKKEDDCAPPGGDQNKPLALARVTLQGRLEFKADHFRLDGKPTTLQAILVEANRVRVSRGEEQLGHERFRV